MADNEAHGVRMESRETPEFDIPLELTLDGADLVTRVPAAEIVSKNDAYVVQNIKVLPNLLSAQSRTYTSGSLLVPDGSGALIGFNRADPNFPPYRRQLRRSDYFSEYYFAPTYAQDVTMPIFGILYGSPENDGTSSAKPQPQVHERAALAIIEDGEMLAGIRTEQGSAGESAVSRTNRIYPTIDVTQYARVNIHGPYSPQSTVYLFSTGMQDLNFTVRYRFFGEGTDYYDLAENYRTYFSERRDPSVPVNPATDLHLQVLGSVDVNKRFIGVPYSDEFSMTDYGELSEIVQSLDAPSPLVTYLGALSGGYNQNLLLDTDLARENGDPDAFDTLMETLRDRGADLSLQANLTRADDSDRHFSPRRHAITDYDTNNAYVYEYDPSDGRFQQRSFSYVRLSPWYFMSLAEQFLEAPKPADYLTIEDLGRDFYADYNREHMLSGYEADWIVRDTLAQLSDSYGLVMKDPFMSLASEAAFVSSVPRTSSEYATFRTTIPFRQLVLNNLVPFSTEPVNLSNMPPRAFVLQDAEFAAIPEFLVSAKSSELMKDLQYQGFWSTEFAKHAGEIAEITAEIRDLRSRIGSDVLADHTWIADDLFMSTYDNGVRVLVNYADSEAVYGDETVPAMDYVILGSEGN